MLGNGLLSKRRLRIVFGGLQRDGRVLNAILLEGDVLAASNLMKHYSVKLIFR